MSQYDDEDEPDDDDEDDDAYVDEDEPDEDDDACVCKARMRLENVTSDGATLCCFCFHPILENP